MGSIRKTRIYSIACDIFTCFVAKEKLKKVRIHETGGGPPPPPLTHIEEAIAWIYADTPGFRGIVSKKVGDSKIVMIRTQHNNDQQAKICRDGCGDF